MSVLVCDDERHIVRLIRVNLERQGYVVRTTFTGVEALELVGREAFDLVVLDPSLPDMSGYEVAERIRSDPATAHVKISMLDGKRQDGDGPGPGGDLYMGKGRLR
ncbi:MAG TPA: response regulator [Fimbriimonas sp.]|nr:response regulator [Fimbriimonas sp.]